MRDVYKGDTDPQALAVRHDVDDNQGSFDTALAMAEWEFAHGYSSTYFLLHGSHYWNADNLVRALLFEELGHEVGVHVNAIAESLRHRRAADWILLEALGDLRSVGLRVDGCVAHGDELCHDGPSLRFVNDEMFLESPRPEVGAADRIVEWGNCAVKLEPRSRSEYHLKYDANWLPRGGYLSDSGGRWTRSFDEVVERFGEGQLHILLHPDWWQECFSKVTIGL